MSAPGMGEPSDNQCERRIGLSDPGFDLLSVRFCCGCCKLLTKSLAFLIALAAAFYLAVTFSHCVGGSSFLSAWEVSASEP